MEVKFDKFSRFETPNFYLCNPGCVLNDSGSLSNMIGVLDITSDEQLSLNFNATSDLAFRAYKREVDKSEVADNKYVKIYDAIKNRRLIYADELGFFVITEVTEGYSDGLTYKDITARSCEEEIAGKNVPFIEDGTYRFQGDLIHGKGMLEMLVETLPLWRVGNVDEDVTVKYRSFEDVDVSKNVLGFMLEDLQDAYECIFIFDTKNRLIHVYSQSNYVRRTDIHITKDDLIDELSVEELSDELYTAITVSGDEDLGISAVNPLGGNTIYKFDYYLDWMSPELRNAVTTWQAEVRSASSGYYALQNSYYTSNEELYNLKAERDKLQTQLDMYQKCRDNCVAGSSQEDITRYNDFIEQAGGTPVPDDLGYIWIKFADNAAGDGITSDPDEKPYIGLAYNKNSKVASLNVADYAWSTFREGDAIQTATNKYTWVVFSNTATSVSSNSSGDDIPERLSLSSDPNGKQYIGIAINQSSAKKSEKHSDYMWSSLSTLATGIPSVIDALSDLITEVTDDIREIDSQIEARERTLADIKSTAENIRSALAFDKAFTPEQLEELQCYIYEGTYTDEYVTITEDMTATEQFSQMKTLYDRAMLQLDKISVPTQKFEVNLENFIFSKTFEHWSEQLETGCLVNVEIDEGNIAELFLANIEVNYDDRELSMTFGNRYNQYDTMSLFKDALGNIQKSANTLSYIKDIVYPIRSGELNKMHEALETSRTLTKNAALASTDEEVVIDGSGYTGRRVLPDGTIDSKQIKINGRNIVFTDDSWETCKTAIGELYFSDGDTKYGVNAEVLMGDIILGNELHIIDNEGNELLSAMNDKIATSVRAGNADVSAAIHEAYDGRLNTIDAGVSDNKLQIAGAINRIEQTASNITQSVAAQFETVNESLNEATASLMSIRGQIRQGIIEDPDKAANDPEKWVVGIAIAEKLDFTGSTHNGYDVLAGGQTLGLYTSKGWQFWINGKKCGWFDSEDSMLHVSNMISEESISVTDNWKFVNESGLGLRFVG